MSERQPIYYSNELAPPPRFLKWLVYLMIASVILAIVALPIGVYAFRQWVPPRYQVTYSERFPVLKLMLPAAPASNTVLPTPQLEVTQSVPLDALLGAPAAGAAATEEAPDEAAETAAVTEEATAEGEVMAEDAVVMLPTETPLGATATLTPMPPTAAPTQEPTQPPAPTSADAAAASLDEEAVALAASGAARPPSNHRNFGFQYVTQSWNNCGPANVTVALSFYGWQEDQTYAAGYLRGGREDKNVSPNEIVEFVNEQSQIRAMYRIGGDMDTLKHLVAGGFPVMVELGYAPEGNDWLGHYQTVVGYDDSVQSFYVIDTYIPSDQGLPEKYRDFDRNWQQFARTFIVFYRPEEESTVMNILGDLSTAEGGYEVALETGQREARENPDNPYPWFNIGKAQTYLGNYDAAATAFDQARLKGLPWRMLWYQFEPFQAYYETGRYSDVLALVESNETTLGGGYVEETYYWEGRVYEAQGQSANAASSFRRAIQQNGRFQAAKDGLARVS